jgi:hypothetical protein
MALAEQAVASIAEEPFDDPRTTDAMTITELAGALGVRPIGPLKELMPQFREARRWEELRTTLAAREAALTARSRALLHGAAPLSALLSATDPPS